MEKRREQWEKKGTTKLLGRAPTLPISLTKDGPEECCILQIDNTVVSKKKTVDNTVLYVVGSSFHTSL